MKAANQGLERAGKVRRARYELRIAVATGLIHVGDFLAEEIPDELRSMPVMELLMAQRGWARQRSVRVLGKAMVGERRPLGDLTERQKNALIEAVGQPVGTIA